MAQSDLTRVIEPACQKLAEQHGFELVDVAFAALSNANGLYCTNAQTSISFVRSGRVGPLRGEARVLRSGKLLSTYEVRVTDAEGGLVAVATITGYGVGARLPLGDA